MRSTIQSLKNKSSNELKEQIDILFGNDEELFEDLMIKPKRSNSKKAIQMRELRARNRRPDNISPDFTKMTSDITYEKNERGQKARCGKVFTKFNPKKAESFSFSLRYQACLYRTTFTFFSKENPNEPIKTNEVQKLIDLVMVDKVDLSKGIYVKQYHHVRIDYSNTKYMNYSRDGLYYELRKFIGRDYDINATLDNNTKVKITNFIDLKKYRDRIDYNKKVQAIATIPRNRNTKQWNDDYDGFWLCLSRISTKEDVDHFEEKYRVKSPLKFTYNFEDMIKEMVRLGKTKKAKFYLNKFDMFSLQRTIQNQIEDRGVLQVANYYKRFFIKPTFAGLEEFIRSLLPERHNNNKDLISRIASKVALKVGMRYVNFRKSMIGYHDKRLIEYVAETRELNLKLFGYDGMLETFGVDYCSDAWLKRLSRIRRVKSKKKEIEEARKMKEDTDKVTHYPDNPYRSDMADEVRKKPAEERTAWLIERFEKEDLSSPEDKPKSLQEFIDKVADIDREAEKKAELNELLRNGASEA